LPSIEKNSIKIGAKIAEKFRFEGELTRRKYGSHALECVPKRGTRVETAILKGITRNMKENSLKINSVTSNILSVKDTAAYEWHLISKANPELFEMLKKEHSAEGLYNLIQKNTNGDWRNVQQIARAAKKSNTPAEFAENLERKKSVERQTLPVRHAKPIRRCP
jgi:hypothetical protein